MIIQFIPIVLITLLSFSNGEFSRVKNLNTKADFFSTDHLGNIYLVEKGVLAKYDSQLKLQSSFSRKDRGAIEFIDTTDPLKLLVYYPEFGTIDFLDSFLAENARMELTDYNIYQQTVVCRSHDNGIWVYDPVSSQLYKLNSELKISIQSQSFNQLFNKEVKPTYLNESEKWLVFSDQEFGLYVFDRLGVYLKNIPVKNVNKFQVIQNTIIYSDEFMIHQHDIVTGLEETLAIPALENEKVKQIRLEQNFLYMLTNKSLIIYKWSI